MDQAIEPISPKALDDERKLEDLIQRNIDIIGPHLMVIGRQVKTSFDKVVDLLAISSDGDLAVIEIKRDRTPREIIAQTLDYGSWVHTLDDADVAHIWARYIEREDSGVSKGQSLDDAFCKHFGLDEMPDEINSEHELIIVASELDACTERIVNYLADYHGVNINAVFFRSFRDGDRQYLTRAWLRDPTTIPAETRETVAGNELSNEYYVSFGGNRNWEDAVKYGYISGGGKSWYSNSLLMLSPGNRVWVNIPGSGYVGVGIVEEARLPIDDFKVMVNGQSLPILQSGADIANKVLCSEDPDRCEYFVRVKWLKSVPKSQAIKEKGFFGNQNTVARPKKPKWVHTVARLKERFSISD
ncbi:hypothetical protein V8Z80_10975 [Orrella sp. JC864]|uniref:hypothetical protein n=1 Tax=Orrella sp. JC864 TaxID=3120298 RepID=UPI00300B5E7F